ncbi:von Willebrand factor A domain-containing protein 5A [Folsomia candida]|nr:von Willebrand factor A domain-containing protein 5A [Folsomia candida]
MFSHTNRFWNFDNNPCGLIWINDTNHKQIPIPLKSVSITASVVHAVAQVEITQVYENSENNPIEASYIFPVDSNGAVTHFQAELDGKVIKGVVKTTEDAKRDYEAAIKQQKTAFLGEETKPDVFHLKIGFLKPGALAKVVIGYVTEVKNDADSHAIRFVIPTTVAPRYVPPSDHDQKSDDLANMTFSSTSPAPLNIKVVACIQGEIKSADSLSSHKILVKSKGTIPEQPGWNKAVVTLVGNVTEMDRDFVLLVTPLEAVMKPRVYYEILENGSLAAMTHLIPSFALKEEKVELIIVVDRSGSMGGQSIRMASAALQLFLHSLPTDCYFNVVGFGSSYEVQFKEGSAKYGPESLHYAVNSAKCISANLGGTEILEPLQHIYSRPSIPGYLRQIFVITDGQVSNTEQVISLVQQNAHNSRLFALGIGASSSRHLVEGMATAGGGTCAFVEGDASIQKATLSQLKNALQPSLTDIKIEWMGIRNPQRVELNTEKTLFGYNKPVEPEVKGSKFSQSPKNIPPIFDGSQLVVFGIFPPGQDRPSGVKLTANSPDGPLTLNIAMNETNLLGSTQMLHKLAVIKLIRELEIEGTMTASAIKDEIVALGVEHGITSKYTSYISVDDLAPTELHFGPMQFRQIRPQSLHYPVAFDVPSSCRRKMARRCSPTEDVCDGPSDRKHHYAYKSNSSLKLQADSKLIKNASSSATFNSSVFMESNSDDENDETSSSPPTTRAQRVLSIVNLQSFDGSFQLTQDLCKLICLSYEEMKAEASKQGWNTAVWATTLAISCLIMTDLKDEKDSWDLVVKKAEKWISQTCRDTTALQVIKESAIAFYIKSGMLAN